MGTFELQFHVGGEAYQQVREYRVEMDHRVIRNQIERRGNAIVTRLRDQEMLNFVRELPQPGEATPYYGTVGTGYRYTLQPQAKGCSLKVENLASGVGLFCSEVLPEIEISLDEGVELREVSNGGLKGLPRHAGYAFHEEEDTQEIVLSVTPDLYAKLVAWKYYGKPLSEYVFVFSPLKVGNLVRVRHQESGEEIDLTGEINW